MILGPGGKRENQGEFYFRFILSITSLYIWILTLISSQRHPKMDSEGDSEFEEKNGRKILLAKKKVPPHSGRDIDTWQKLRLPTSQVYTLENANSNFLSKPPQCLTGGSENPLGSEGVMETSFNSSIARKYIITNSQCPLQGDTGNI